MSAHTYVQVDQQKLALSNLDKVLYPATGFTKGQVIDYYRHIAPAMLPHLSRRPVTLHRYPNGVGGESFYEKECPIHKPDWVSTASIWSERTKRSVRFCVVNDLPTLLWVANLAALELHTLMARTDDIQRPTMVTFDLDPGEGTTVLDCGRLALELRDTLADVGLRSFPKTSGGKGLHVYVPLNTPVTYEQTKTFAHAVATVFERHHPDRVTANMRKEARAGKVFIDWSQNEDFKSTVSVYSLRAREHPTVSTPVTWAEVDDALHGDDPARLTFEADAVIQRMEKQGDLFAPVLEVQQELPKTADGGQS